jgi:hypothetical protein
MRKPKQSPTEVAAEQVLQFARSLRSKLKRTHIADEAEVLSQLKPLRQRLETLIAKIESMRSE